MPIEQFILFSICLVVISALITLTFYRKFRHKLIRISPLILSFLGTMVFGIGPFIFDYAQGVSLGLLYLFLGIYFGIAFISSFATLIYIRIKK